MLGRSEVRELLDRHGVAPKRSLGQNFVVDPNTVRRIARLAEVKPGQPVVEIGAGVGCLTLALAEQGADIIAVEYDDELQPILADVLASAPDPSKVALVHADAMTLDWAALLRPFANTPVTLVANLPYNIATPLIADLLDDVPQITDMLVMVQAEVGHRLAAPPGSKIYGGVSVKVAYWAEAAVVGNVPPTVFFPQPRVESALVRIGRRPEPLGPETSRAVMFDLVRTAFGQRRKMLRKSLGGLVSIAQFAAAEVDPADRPERLGVEAWVALGAVVAESSLDRASSSEDGDA